MTARTPLRWLAWLGADLTFFDLLSDLPTTVGDVRVFCVRLLGLARHAAGSTRGRLGPRGPRWGGPGHGGPVTRPALARGRPLLLIEEPVPEDRFFWLWLVYVPAIPLLLADLRPWLAIRHRRGAEIGETPCPLRLP
jgi:hypothetical protein